MIPLACHSHYSLMQGTQSPAALCRRAKKLGYQRLALTDTDNLYGLWRFIEACDEHELQPLIGATVTEPANGNSIVCLVENDTGYRNLCRLLTLRHRNGRLFDLPTATATHKEGLRVLASQPKLLTDLHDRQVTVSAALCHRPNQHNSELRRTARHLGVTAAAVPASFFADPNDMHRHRLLRAIDHNTVLSRLSVTKISQISQISQISHNTQNTQNTQNTCAHPDAWLAAPSEYQHRFEVWPETLAASQEIAEGCVFVRPDFGIVMPPYETKGNDCAAELHHQALDGARHRYGDDLSEAVVDRLQTELAMIEQMNFSSYFLAVRHIVPKDARTCGRGSGAASLVAYCLGLTNVCPIRHNLYFQRFLNPGRTDPPDLDIDFAWDERDAIIATVLAQYGVRAAMVSSHILLQPRMAIREAARVHGLSEQEISRLTRRLPWLRHFTEADEDDEKECPDTFHSTTNRDDGFVQHIRKIPNLKDLDIDDTWKHILLLARGIIGTPRHLSVHPGGVVLTPHPLCDYVPVETAPKGVPIIQWDKNGAESAGLVKIDLLGNRSLGVIRDAIAGLRKNGHHLDEAAWQPDQDAATRQSLAQGDTMGCFYIESPAMRLLQQKSGRGDFESLVIHSSIIRPAANECIREYLRRLHGGTWLPLAPECEEVLAETYGIMVYQEDVSRMAVALAGFSHADADRLRKIISKKDATQKLADYAERFAVGCQERQVNDAAIAAIWRMMMSFDGYSFCKPHSASYAMVSFQAAWLKRHYPAEFMAAVISNQGGYYSTFAYVSEARRMGLTVLSPDIAKSSIEWTGASRAIRVGLMAIKNVSHACSRRIISERHQQPFASMSDFLGRVRPNGDESRALVLSGALDALAANHGRSGLLWQCLAWQRTRDQPPDLFGSTLAATATPTCIVPPLPPETPLDRHRRQFEALGFLSESHPIELYASHPKLRKAVKAAAIPRHKTYTKIDFAGWLVCGKTVSTKQGAAMEFLTFEDETGLVETTFFPKTYQAYCHLLAIGQPYLLTGLVEKDFGATTLTVEKISRLTPTP